MENTNIENQEVQGQEEAAKMELLPAGSEYRDIAKVAKELGMNYVGVKKDDLLAQVNEYITKINNGEVEAPENEVEIPQASDDTNENEGTEAPTAAKPSPARAAAARTATKAKERTVRQATKKWFEEPGANPYKPGDIVEIIGGKDLIGRKLQIIEPSAKKDMVKGKLIHPVTGGLQNTVIAISFERIELRESANALAADEPTEVNDNQDGVNDEPTNENETNDQEVETTENEDITAGSDESVDIPNMEVDTDEEEEKKAE